MKFLARQLTIHSLCSTMPINNQNSKPKFKTHSMKYSRTARAATSLRRTEEKKSIHCESVEC